MCQKESSPVTVAPSAGCGCSHQPASVTIDSLKGAMQPSESVRWIGEGRDLDFPPVPFPSLRVLKRTGEALLRVTVERHHALLAESEIAQLFAPDPGVFRQATARTADFIVEACGGEPRYSPAHGHTCMRTRHFPFTIDEAARITWLKALWQALEEVGFPLDVREEYWNWLEAMSIRMINRRTTKGAPARFPYASMMGCPAVEPVTAV